MDERTPRRLAKPLIILATLIWGSSFVVMKDTLSLLPTFYLLAFRFTAAAAILALLFWKRWRALDRGHLIGGCVMGLLLFTAYAFQTFGLEHTTPGKNAFLTAVYCVIVPFLYWLIARRRPDRFHVLGAVLCVAGIGLVSLNGDLTVNIGDLLTLVSGFFFAAHIVAVARYAGGRDIFLLTVLQFAAFAALAWIFALLFAGPVPTAALNGEAVWKLLYLTVFASCGGLLFQNIGQKYTNPATAAVLLSLEAPFGVLFSIAVAGERPTAVMCAGFALIFLAVICSETKFGFLKKRVDNGPCHAYTTLQQPMCTQTCDEEK